MLNWMSRTALEVISQGGLGVSIDPLTRDTTDEYTQALKDLMFVPLSSRNHAQGLISSILPRSPTLYGLGALRLVLTIPRVSQLGPAWLRRFFVEMTPHRGLHKLKDIVDIMTRRAVQIFEERKAALRRGESEMSKQTMEGKDLLSLMGTSASPTRIRPR